MSILNEEVSTLDLSVRAFNRLKSGDIRTVGDLMSCSAQDLINLKYMGKISFKEIQSVINDYIKPKLKAEEILEISNPLNTNETMENPFELIDSRLDRIEKILLEIANKMNTDPQYNEPINKYVDINGAARITSKTPNALRVQVSLGKLTAIKKGSRLYFDREYLEQWIAGKNN